MKQFNLQVDLNSRRDEADATKTRRRESIATTTDEEGDDTGDDATSTSR
jgi:hypothetical protein